MAKEANRTAIEFLKSSGDPAYFCSEYLVIDEPQGETVSTIPFSLWPEQVNLLWAFAKYPQVVVLKARQLGISWAACAYALWLCLFNEGRVVLLFSKGQMEANELARRIQVMYDRLPDWFKAMLPPLTKSVTREVGWGNGSHVQSLPATESAGRTFTASLLILDEFAFMTFAQTLYTSVKPTIDGGGRMIIISTANGVENLFHLIWKSAEAGANNFKPVFLPWWVRPGRDKAWRAKVEADAQFSWTIAQEYPATPEEAFQSTGTEKFLPDILWWDLCKGEIPPLTRNDPVVLSADAGISNDSFALVGVRRHPLKSRHTDIVVQFVHEWKPPRSGLIDFNAPFKLIEKICARDSGINVASFCFDPYQLYFFGNLIQQKGFVITEEFSQAGKRLEADKQLLDLITQRRIVHDGNKELRAHIQNADKKPAEDKLRIVKRSPDLKIDLCVALSMASYQCLVLPL